MATITVKEETPIKHVSPLFRDGFISMVCIGKSGCGKTRFLSSILPGISPDIKFILIATQVRENPFHLAIKDFFEKRDIYCNICDDPDDLEKFIDIGHESGLIDEKHQGLLIFDDFVIANRTGQSIYQNFAVKAVTRYRNYHWSFITIAQDPAMISPSVRNCSNVRVLFACNSRSALMTFNKDLYERLADNDAYSTMVDYILNRPYTYIMVRERPFEISAGSLNKIKPILTERDVIVPNLRELEKELGVHNREEMDAKTKFLQRKIGNTSRYLYR